MFISIIMKLDKGAGLRFCPSKQTIQHHVKGFDKQPVKTVYVVHLSLSTVPSLAQHFKQLDLEKKNQ